jgi:zinc transport system substrate-binding protein
VMEGAGTPQLLIKGAGGSAHTYSLRPSDARMLSKADLIIRVSPRLEGFLDKPLASLSEASRLVTLADAPGMELLPMRAGGLFDAHSHAGHGSGAHKGGHGDGESEAAHRHDEHNPHLWLSPENAAAIADHLASVLASKRPAQAALFKANAAKLKEKLAALGIRLKAELTPLRGRQFIVFHDAYHYFEDAFGVQATGSIAISPERQPGAARLQQLRARIGSLDSGCVFSEPQFEPKLVSMLIAGTGVKAGSLDPLGADLAEGPQQYFQLMENLAAHLKACLG